MEHTLRVVAFREGDYWIAQCLEHDICVQAPDVETLQGRLNITLLAEDITQRKYGKGGIETLPPAPEHFFHMWEKQMTFNRTGVTDDLRAMCDIIATFCFFEADV